MNTFANPLALMLRLMLLAGYATFAPGMEFPTTDNQIEGLVCSLRPEKVFWFEGQHPVLKVGLRNKSEEKLYVILEPWFAELSIDGRRFGRISNMMPKYFPFPPGTWYDDIAISASNHWSDSDSRPGKLLTPGEHTVQVGYFVYSTDVYPDGPVAKVVSNPVQIKILPRTGSSPESRLFFQSSLEFDKEIDFDRYLSRSLYITPGYLPRMIKFERKGQDIKAVLAVEARTSPKTNWRAKLELLDDNGFVLACEQKEKETSGRKTLKALIAGGVGYKTFRQHFHFKNRYRGNEARFRVSFTNDEEARRPIKDDGKGAWGKPVAGLRCRIRPVTGSYGHFKADIRNEGDWRFYISKTQQLCELSVDGQWYRAKGEDSETVLFEPQDQYDSIPVNIDDDWYRKTDHLPLKLTPGRHVVQLAFPALRDPESPLPCVWFLSDEIEIDVPEISEAQHADQEARE
ncbi:MAG: hypothetical protein ACYS0H_25065 [Planctomycetota bacterium]|jgi:hypothetical protein